MNRRRSELSDGIQPFRIDMPQDDLDDLHSRLGRTRWPGELPDAGWACGVPHAYLKELVHYWRHEYDWRAAEARLNQWPQFTTTVDGATIHFAHLRSPDPDAIPLLMIHGWPGSFAEFTEVAEPLTDPDSDPAFILILPSIPGFGLSGPTYQRGWEHQRVVASFAELLRRLDYPRYRVLGMDGLPRPAGRRRGQGLAAYQRDAVLADPDSRVSRPHLLRKGARRLSSQPEPSTAPTALAVFPPDNFIPLLHIAERTNTIVQWTEYDRGGHFAALEQPELLAGDIRCFFRGLRA